MVSGKAEKCIKMKRENQQSKYQKLAIRNPKPHTLFALILAALHSSDSYDNSHIINLCLNRILRQNQFPHTIISLLPILLKSERDEIARKSVELVGAASLMSIELNEKIALEDGVIVCLISLLGSSRRSVSMAACNAALDLSSTSVGRERLLEFSGLEKLVFSFIQVQMSLPAVICLSYNGEGSRNCPRLVFEKEDPSLLLLQATLLFINSSTTKHLEKIPRHLSGSLAVCLKGLWKNVHSFLVCETSECNSARDTYISNVRTNDLAESIFRLCMDDLKPEEDSNAKQIEKSLFNWDNIKFEEFISSYWEESPLVFRGTSKALLHEDFMFNSLAKCFQLKHMPSSLPSMLQNLTACPPIASDELDVLHFLEEVRDDFGCPIIYQQDIRVVKTQQSEGELHYFSQTFGSCSSRIPLSLHINEILKCEEAYDHGYTIALRGMEFRLTSIAAIADSLASLFGQPSAGVNMYLTPPNSQGLSRHSDDHCVFVLQLIGTKNWKIFPQSRLHLPRLYDSVNNSEADIQPSIEGMQFLLKEGDVLYIPRGVPHEAHTIVEEDGSAGFSLHLTLAIEVEPPFGWEGFVHVGLNHWSEKHKETQQPSSGSVSLNLHVMCVNLLHVGIALIGDIDPTFRKACMVGQANQRVIFKHLISKINTELSFAESMKRLDVAVQEHDDLFQRLRWLQHLNCKEDLESHKSSSFPVDLGDVLQFCSQNVDMMDTTFMEVKSRFCSETVVENVEPDYEMLLDRYKKVRRQYTQGMLSLHITGGKP